MKILGLRSFGSTVVASALLAAACGEDTVDNPFNATEGASSGSSTSAGDDAPVSLSADGTESSSSSDGADASSSGADPASSESGSTMAIADSGDASTSTGEPSTTTGDASTSTGPEQTGSSSSEGGSNHEPCPVGEIPNAPLPSSITDNSSMQDSEFSGTCGGGGAPDMAYTFTAPFDGDFTFDTQGSSFDTVMYVLDGTCDGPQLMCSDDDLIGTNLSMGSVPLVQGQTVTVVVDAFGLAGGSFTLTAREGSVTCPIDIGSTVPQTVPGQTLIATDEFVLSCGTGASADTAFAFTAPQDGTYTFEVSNNDFDTLMAVLDGLCEGPELGCNDDLLGATGGASGLFMSLAAGQTVTIVVEGYFESTGTFDLTVGALAGDCPDEDLGSMAVPFTVMGDTSALDNATAGACGGLSSNDYAYTWTAPDNGMYRFDTGGSAFDTVLYLRDTTCTGTEIACSDDALGMETSNAVVTLAAGETVVAVVDGFNASGAYSLTVSEAFSSGNCCFAHASAACVDAPVNACVCAFDPFCCDVSWTAVCADEAMTQCGAICP